MVVVCSSDNEDVNEDNDDNDDNNGNYQRLVCVLKSHRRVNNRLTNNTKANPLLLPGGSGSCDSHCNFLVTLVEVLDNLFALLFDLHNSSVLLDDQGIKILHELEQLCHLLLNLQQLLVTVLDCAQCSASTALAVALHQSLAENLTVAGVFNCGLDLFLCSIGANNTVLATHLLLNGGLELGFDTLVLGDDGLDLSIDSVHMAFVHGALALRLGFDSPDTLNKRAVSCRGLGCQGIQLTVGLAGRGAVDIAKNSGLEHLDLFQAALDLANAVADVTALVTDRIGVLAGH